MKLASYFPSNYHPMTNTGGLKTKGKGGGKNKDALISLVLKNEEDVKEQNKNLPAKFKCELNIESEIYGRNCLWCPCS